MVPSDEKNTDSTGHEYFRWSPVMLMVESPVEMAVQTFFLNWWD